MDCSFRGSSNFGRALLLAFCCSFGWSSDAWATDPVFTNVTASAGITYDSQPIEDFHQATLDNQLTFQELVTGGAAAGDYDNDGWTDLFITRYYDADILYHNNGDGTFSDATSSAFPSGFAGQWTNGTAWGDVDNDGDLDLYVTGSGRPSIGGLGETRHFLYINDGVGHFTEEAVSRGAEVGDGSRMVGGSSVSFGDYDNDGFLDMYVTEWRLTVASDPKWSRLLRNQGAANPGHFVDVTDAAGVSLDTTYGPQPYRSLGFTPRFVDLDRDGYSDLAIASDYGTTRIFWNDGDGTFTDSTYTGNAGTDPSDFFGSNDMGSAIGDLDGDGRLDWFTTSVTQTRAHRYSGSRQFLNIEATVGVAGGNGTWGWGTDIFDYDNDQDMDVVMTNGWSLDPYQDDQSILWRNEGQNPIPSFTNVSNSAGVTDTGMGRGLLTFDYDNDGDLDLFIMNLHGDPVLYRNDGGNQNDWLRIKTVGTISNANGVGAFVTVTPDLTLPNDKLVTEIDGSSNFLSQSEVIAHFGLGLNAETVDQITVEWPASGLVQNFYDIAPNQLLTIVEGIADFNSDGMVDAADYAAWRDAMGTSVTPWTGADGNGDGYVDEDDYKIWRSLFGLAMTSSMGSGAGAAASAAVPEPAAVAIFSLALIGWGIGFRRKPGRRTKCPR